MENTQKITQLQIEAEKQRIYEFCDRALNSHRREGVEFKYGEDREPFTFTLSFQGRTTAVVNYLRTEYEWRQNGICTALFAYLEAADDVQNVGAKSAHAPEMQLLLKKRGYKMYADDDYFKTRAAWPVERLRMAICHWRYHRR